MNLKYRCQGMVYNREKKRYYRCKKCYYNTLKVNNNIEKYCWSHYNQLCKEIIIVIQKMYRGYKCRKKINNIYIKLPDDIQQIILNYVREDFYYKRYCNNIYTLINKRFIFHNIVNSSLIQTTDEYILNIFKQDINPVFYLYNKYFDIVYYINNTNIKFMTKQLFYLSQYLYTLVVRLRAITQEYFFRISTGDIIDPENFVEHEKSYSILLGNLNILTELDKKCQTINIP